MIEFQNYNDVPKDFTGVCKFLYDNSIRYYKDRKLHREAGPAIECVNGTKYWLINGQIHREDGPAVEYTVGNKSWYYKGKGYGAEDDFTNESWKEKVEELKHEEELSIFL